ncbi:MAG: hypothetical protein L0228_11250 [Planctomycetes bacterium]|nr:hypothetical protein [Planctomycetota bacterium]
MLYCAAAVCAGGGCWEKIEYRGTFPETAKSSTTPAPPAAVGDAPSPQPQPAPTVGERYTAKVESNPTTPPGTPAEAPPTDPTATETPESATNESTPAAISTKRAAWILGSRFSLAALANDRGIAAENVPKWFDEAQTMAESLNIPLAALPERPATATPDSASREVLSYMLDQEKAIGPKLANDFGDDHDAIFRLALRTNLLRVLNTPGSKAVETLSKSITDLGPRSGLPIGLWQPLLDVLNEGATSAAIRTAVPQMHERIEQHLAAEP